MTNENKKHKLLKKEIAIATNLILNLIIIVFQPIWKILEDFTKVFINISFHVPEEKRELINKIKKKILKLQKVQIAIYYIFFTFLQIIMFLNLGSGKIMYIKLENLLIITFCSFLFIATFVTLFIKNVNSDKIKYITYIQILSCFPVIIAYWITSIEGRDFFLNEFTREEWISIFGVIVGYFSACFIGLIVGYNTLKGKKLSQNIDSQMTP